MFFHQLERRRSPRTRASNFAIVGKGKNAAGSAGPRMPDRVVEERFLRAYTPEDAKKIAANQRKPMNSDYLPLGSTPRPAHGRIADRRARRPATPIFWNIDKSA